MLVIFLMYLGNRLLVDMVMIMKSLAHGYDHQWYWYSRSWLWRGWLAPGRELQPIRIKNRPIPQVIVLDPVAESHVDDHDHGFTLGIVMMKMMISSETTWRAAAHWRPPLRRWSSPPSSKRGPQPDRHRPHWDDHHRHHCQRHHHHWQNDYDTMIMRLLMHDIQGSWNHL